MNEEEINIAIAESLGWKNCKVLPKPQKYWDVSNVPEMVRIGSPPVAGSCTFPDYVNSLDAIHEVELSMDADLYRAFSNNLYLVVLENGLLPAKRAWLSANARQRAEAFLKTIGKWKE